MKRKTETWNKAAKVLATGAVCAVLIATPALAADSTGSGTAGTSQSTQTTASSAKTLTVTLDSAIEKALANSSAVIEASNEYEKAKINLKSTQKKADDMYKLLRRPDYSQLDQDMFQLIVYAPEVQQLAVNLAEKSEQAAIASTKVQIITQYYTIASCGKTENAKLDALEKAQRQYDVTNSKFKVGMASKLEVTQAQLEVDAARIGLDAARNDTQQNKRTLCAAMGLDPNASITLASTLEYKPLEIGSVDNAAKKLVAESPLVAIDEISYQMAEKEYNYNMRYLADFTYGGQVAQKTYDTAKAKFENTKRTTESNAYKSIESLQLAERQYNTAVKAKELQQEVYRLAVLRYENGLATQNDVLDAAANLTEADTTIIGALLQYNIAKTAYEQNLISAQ